MAKKKKNKMYANDSQASRYQNPRKSLINYSAKSPEQIAALAAMTVPVALAAAWDQYDDYKQDRKKEKLKKRRFQNRTKMSGITSVKIQKLP
jgi:hypothetical protein